MPRRPELTVPLILAWADAHFQRTGRWPKTTSGPVRDGPLGENWRKIDNGLRGLDGGSSLAQLLERCRGVRNVQDLLMLTEAHIVDWAVTHKQRTGRWPTEDAGPVEGVAGEAWKNIDQTLRDGTRGLPGGSSLAQLLGANLSIRNRASIPPLTVDQILAWADLHRERTGRWPRAHDGPIPEVPGETRVGIDSALAQGHRGLPGGSSLAAVLVEFRGAKNAAHRPRLSRKQVRAWARAHFRRTGKWPTATSGPVLDAPGETWKAVEMALSLGLRGLKKGTLSTVLRPCRQAAAGSLEGRGPPTPAGPACPAPAPPQPGGRRRR